MDRATSVLLLTDHAMSVQDARASLGAAGTVRRASFSDAELAADVVVLDQTLAEPPSTERLADLAARVAGAPILSVIAEGACRYRWLRIRATGDWFRIEASGTGTLAEAVRDATRSSPVVFLPVPGAA